MAAGEFLSRAERSFHDLLIHCAQDEGFPLAGAVDLDRAMEPEGEFSIHIRSYDRWLETGMAGEMSYLHRGRDRRADPRNVFPEAKSILCVAIPYHRHPAGAAIPTEGPRYARYLQGPDYHHEIAERLERVMTRVARERQEHGQSVPNWKVCVDTSAVLERAWASLAGLGWIGKNTMLIHPRHGSYLFLGEVLIDHETGWGPSPIPNYCGQCRRCLDACPTKAFLEPRKLDANRCISYLTLEKRSEISLSEAEKEKLGPWIAGCDICQEVCPFNLKPSRDENAVTEERAGAVSVRGWMELLTESEEQYKSRVRNSSLSRVKPPQFRRNLAISLANAVKIAVAPAERELMRDLLLPLVRRRLDEEPQPDVRKEWLRCVQVFSES